jgi:hypothetical protein
MGFLVRSKLENDGRTPLFYTGYGNDGQKRCLHALFIAQKKEAEY